MGMNRQQIVFHRIVIIKFLYLQNSITILKHVRTFDVYINQLYIPIKSSSLTF